MKSTVLSLAILVTLVSAVHSTHQRITGCESVSSQCPLQNPTPPLHLANPIDCGSFCKCDHGNAVYFKCPAGLHFNVAKQECDWPASANCHLTPPPGTGCDAVECPAENGEFVLHLPNPDSCTSFCTCNWGDAIFMECPAGLHFNPILMVCDWPENAGCQSGGSTATTPPREECGHIKCPSDNEFSALYPNPWDCNEYCKCEKGTATEHCCPTGLHFNAALQQCDHPTNAQCDGNINPPPPQPPSNNTGCHNADCPAENGDFAVLLPNSEDCGSYCACDWGTAIPMECPEGLHFNPVLQVCDYPENANCEIAGGNGCELVTTCPPENNGNAIHLPNPSDCGSFCKCDWGEPIWFDCPGDLLFNPILQVCDWPENVDCGNGNNENPTPTNAPPTPPPTPNGCDKIDCPAENGDYALHLPNPEDCGSFCVCDWGNAHLVQCPEGLHFNAELQVCDWPENANCNVNTGDGCELVTCPPQNGEFALHLPNPLDCGSFCKCDWGVAYYFPCPAALHFNAVLQVCDYPWHANCSFKKRKH